MVPLKIAHVLYSYLPVTENWIYAQLRFNTSCNHTVISLFEQNCGEFPWSDRHAAFTLRSPLDYIRLLFARYRLLQPARFFSTVIEKEHPAILHGHFATESWRILPYAKRMHVPLVTTFYGLDVDKLPRRRYWKERYPQLFAAGARFFVEGPFMGEQLVALGCPEEKVRVVFLGVDRERIEKTVQREMGESNLALVNVLFVGLGREKKGALDAARIFAAAAHVDVRLRLHIIGSGRYRQPVERFCRQAGILHRVVFHGSVSYERYLTILATSAIVLVPSCRAVDGDSEGGAPVVCIEALVAGKVVVGTTHCDIPNIVTHDVSGLLAAEHDIPLLTHHLLQLAASPEMRLKMGERGVEQGKRNHDATVQAAKIAELYREVVHG